MDAMRVPRFSRDFQGSVHQRTTDMGKVTDTLTVYSDAKPRMPKTDRLPYLRRKCQCRYWS